MKHEKKIETSEPTETPVDEKETQIQDLTCTLQRLQAEFDNYRKRIDKEVQEKKQVARAEVIKSMLPVLDSFEQALKNEPGEGLQRLYAQFIDALKQDGLEYIPTEGKFDPHRHEVLLTEKSEEEEGTILEELQRGYLYQGNLLRTSKVKVSKP